MTSNATTSSRPSIVYTIVDAFTSSPFSGNPASVVITEEPLDENKMQLIAKEFNLSETAFVTPHSPSTDHSPVKGVKEFRLRWFTPAKEVDLCGHATLASAHVVFSSIKQFSVSADSVDQLHFHTRSGVLIARKLSSTSSTSDEADGSDRIELRFPAGIPEPLSDPSVEAKVRSVFRKAAGVDAEKRITFVGMGKEKPFRGALLVEISWEGVGIQELEFKPQIFEELAPTFDIIIVTTHPSNSEGSASSKYDFISRVFGPIVGIPEDPVTGFAHCLAGPYWHEKLSSINASKGGDSAEFVMHARQASPQTLMSCSTSALGSAPFAVMRLALRMDKCFWRK